MSDCGDGVIFGWVSHNDHVAFVDFTAVGVECIGVFAGGMGDGFDAAMTRGAVDVDIEYAHEDANADGGFVKGFKVFYFVDRGDFAITCSDDGATL